MCKRNSFHHIFQLSLEEIVNVLADLEDHFARSKTMTGTRSSHHFVPISCNKIVSMYVSCICDAFWWVGIVTEVNVHKGDLKIEFLHPHGPRKTFSWPSVADKCFVPVSNILCIITAPTTITRQMYWISDIDFE